MISSLGRTRRLGVFGGTFDPIHNGHFSVAEAVRARLCLDQVLFVVAANQWMRSNPPVAPAYARLKMVELAIENVPYFRVSDMDIVRAGKTYTVDTLTSLRAKICQKSEMYLIVGADSAMVMDEWKMAQKLRSLTEVVAVGRPGIKFQRQSLPELHPAKTATYIDGPMIDISATIVRNLVMEGKTVSGLVADPVINYIRVNGLYT